MTLKERAQSLKRDIPAVFLALKDKDTPISAKVLAGITVCYALSPVDLIPDFIPVLGYLDDLILLPALVALTVKLIPGEVWERNRARSEHLWENGKPEKMVLCNPNLPDLAADSVAGHPGAMLHKRRMTGHLQPVIRRIFPANAAHTPHSNQSPADAPRLPARPVSTSPFFIKSPLPFSVTPF